MHNGGNPTDASTLGPWTAAIDTSVTPNRLYVADSGNDLVLAWHDVTSIADDALADLVIGQPDFFSNAPGLSADNLDAPFGVAVDAAGNLYVGDSHNNRVLEYNTPFAACASFPCVGGGANRVFGQGGSFTSNIPNNGGVSVDSLNLPIGVAVDPNSNLYIVDSKNNRVLEYNTPLSTDTTADLVFGQDGSFTSADRNKGGVSADSLNEPEGVAVDASGNVYISDTLNFRVLEYNMPLSTDTTADRVFGQGGTSFTSTNFACIGGANSLCYPDGVAVDTRGNVYIADTEDSRVLEYDRPLSTNTTADAVFGQGAASLRLRSTRADSARTAYLSRRAWQLTPTATSTSPMAPTGGC